MMKTTQGFTIIEILVGIVILAVMMTALSLTLNGSLRMNRQSQIQINATTGTQQVIEDVQNAWMIPSNYIAACVPNLNVPAGYSVKFINLSSRAETISQTNVVSTSAPQNDINKNSTCTASTNATLTGGLVPTMRRIVVQSGKGSPQVVGPQDVKLTLDVLRP